MDALLALIALVAGLLGGWVFARARGQRETREMAETLRAEKAAVENERQGLELELATERVRREEAADSQAREREAHVQERERAAATQKQLEDAFAKLAREALKDNSEQFLELSAQRIAPLKEALKGIESKTTELERARAKAYGALQENLGALLSATNQLRSKSESLETALRGTTQARGRWGELALRNLVEAAGMTKHCDFIEQEAVEGGTRPDMVVRLPDGDGIPVDAKVPLTHYWLASQSTDPDERAAALARHADSVRRHVIDLAKRDYSAFVKGRIDYTVLFLTGDPLLSAAFEHRPDLLDEAIRNRVLIATPVTLVALLRTAGLLWQQKAIDENAHAIAEGSRELFSRVVKWQDHFARVGRGLEQARKAYNDAVGSYQSRVLPAGRRVEELNTERGPRLAELGEVEGELRRLPQPEPVEPAPDA